MKTRDEILASWNDEGIYTDWYAIDSYDPVNGAIHRLFVGIEDDAADMMRDYYSQHAELAQQPFYRLSLIDTDAAHAFFAGETDELDDERGEYTITEAAGILSVSRQRVHALLQNGQLEGHKRGNSWFIYRYSVENRLAR